MKLYRDIPYYHPPLAPYLLALITAMTGSSLASYTMIGAAIALLTASAIYAIVRIVASPAAAGTASLLFVNCSVSSISGRTSNYLFPEFVGGDRQRKSSSPSSPRSGPATDGAHARRWSSS